MPTNKEKVSQILDIITDKYGLKDNPMASQGLNIVNKWLDTQNDADLDDLIKKIKEVLDAQ